MPRAVAPTKSGEIHKDQNVRVMQTVQIEGVDKALVSKDGAVAAPLGWVNMVLAGKTADDLDSAALIPTPMLSVTFDLKVHTAQSLTRVLAQNRAKEALGVKILVSLITLS